MLSVRGASKAFGSTRALRGVDLDLAAGEVHALVGENGAGKSTLIKVITGVHALDQGSVRGPDAGGVAVIYQHPTLLPDLGVAENLAIGRDGPWISWRARRARARELLAAVGAEIDPDVAARELSPAQRQLVELARVLAADARVLILDEPTAVLPKVDAERLLSRVLVLRARGVGILYVSHRLEEVERIADVITVLRDGERVWHGPAAAVGHGELVRRMTRRELARAPIAERAPGADVRCGARLLAVRELTCERAGLSKISFELHAGEVLGVAGLVGAGRTALAQCLVGLLRFDAGEVTVGGRPRRFANVAEALAAGVAYLPEDRLRQGVVGPMSVAANITLPRLARFTRHGLLRASEEAREAERIREELDIRMESTSQPVETLSGGNQQKVALGRCIAASPSVLLLDEPTQGIDVAGRADIHALIRAQARAGRGVLLISSDLPELLGVADRIAVLCRGRLAGVLSAEDADEESLLALALGLASA